MAGSRYSLIPKAFWQYLGPAYRGLDADVTALEAAAGSQLPSGSTLAYNPTAAQISGMDAGTLYVTGP